MMAYYARKCDADGIDQVGGDNLLWLDGRLSLRHMQRNASEWARESGAPGYNIYRNLRDPRPLIQHIYIKVKPL